MTCLKDRSFFTFILLFIFFLLITIFSSEVTRFLWQNIVFLIHKNMQLSDEGTITQRLMTSFAPCIINLIIKILVNLKCSHGFLFAINSNLDLIILVEFSTCDPNFTSPFCRLEICNII